MNHNMMNIMNSFFKGFDLNDFDNDNYFNQPGHFGGNFNISSNYSNSFNHGSTSHFSNENPFNYNNNYGHFNPDINSNNEVKGHFNYDQNPKAQRPDFKNSSSSNYDQKPIKVKHVSYRDDKIYDV